MKPLHHVTSKYDALAAEYDATYSDGQAPTGMMKLNLEASDLLTWRFLEPYLPDDKSVPILDAGGGTGKWAIRIAEQGYQEIRIIDISPGMLSKAEDRFNAADLGTCLTTHEGDIRKLPWPDETFGFVLSEGDPISYCLDDYPKAIGEMVRVCRPGGMIVVAADDALGDLLGTLQMEGVEAAAEHRKHQLSVDPYGLPVRCFTPREMEEVFTAAGAEVVKILSKPAALHLLQPAFYPKLIEDQNLQLALMEAEIWACEQGYITAGVHLQVIARKHS